MAGASAPWTDPPGDSRSGLEALARQIGGPASVDVVVNAVLDRYGPPSERGWVGLVDDLGRMLGRRVSWQVGPASEVRQSLSEESVAVGWGAPAAQWRGGVSDGETSAVVPALSIAGR